MQKEIEVSSLLAGLMLEKQHKSTGRMFGRVGEGLARCISIEDGESNDRFSVLMDLRRWASENIKMRRSSSGCLVAIS